MLNIARITSPERGGGGGGGDSDTDETPMIVGPNDFSTTVAESAAASDIESPPSARSEG